MARHRVLAKDLADRMSISRNAVSALRKAEKMPEIGGDRWEQVCAAINALSKIGETITPLDLIEYIPEKEPPSSIAEPQELKSRGKGRKTSSKNRSSGDGESHIWIVPPNEAA